MHNVGYMNGICVTCEHQPCNVTNSSYTFQPSTSASVPCPEEASDIPNALPSLNFDQPCVSSHSAQSSEEQRPPQEVTPFTIMPRSAAAVERSFEEFLSPMRVIGTVPVSTPADSSAPVVPSAESSSSIPVGDLCYATSSVNDESTSNTIQQQNGVSFIA